MKFGAAGTFTFVLSGCDVSMTPKDAKTHGADFTVLSAQSANALEQLGEALVPGAAEAGIAYYIDAQLRHSAENCLSFLRYMDWPGAYADFYDSAIKAFGHAAQTAYGASVSALTVDQKTSLIQHMLKGDIDWLDTAPPPFLFYFVLRSDAVDVVYGTMAGFEALDVPYFAHIEPPSAWGA